MCGYVTWTILHFVSLIHEVVKFCTQVGYIKSQQMTSPLKEVRLWSRDPFKFLVP